ncbi:hypothetical protein JCM11251_004116 [Rhodosporidiobolus azoricus]
MPTDYNLVLQTPVQCETQTLTWSGEAGVTKSLYAWVGPNNYFSERIRSNLTAAIGTVEWTCDFPAGASVAFEIMNHNASSFASTPFFQVQPGTTDACLFKNPGQLAPERMKALASSLSSASPQLFTGYSTTSSPSATSSSASATATFNISSAPAAPSSSSAQSSDGISVGALAGGIVGGLAAVLGVAAVIFFCLRRRGKDGRFGSSSASTSQRLPSHDVEEGGGSGGGGGFFRSMSVNPVDAWRRRVVSGRPASAFTRRSRAFSFGTNAPPPLGDSMSTSSPLSPSSLPPPVLATIAAASPKAQQAQASLSTPASRENYSQRQQGPRAGVPEVVDEGDQPFGAYGSSSHGLRGRGAPFSSSQSGELDDPSSFERGGTGGGGRGGAAAPMTAPITYPQPPALGSLEGQELLGDGVTVSGVGGEGGMGVVRPPTRLTTPGGLTSYGGEGGRRESIFSSEGSTAPYASYSR